MKERNNYLLRFLDRYLGIPLLFVCALFKRRRKLPETVSSIALLKTAGIGDTTLLSAIIYDLQSAFPSATITLFTGKENFEMGKLIAPIDVIALPMTKPLNALTIVRRRSFTLFIDADPWPRINALFTLFSHARFTIGFKTEKQHRHHGYDAPISHSSTLHELENYRNLITPLKIPKTHLPQIALKISDEKKKRVALHLFAAGSRAHLKMWEDDKWKELITFFTDQGFEVVLTGSLKDREKLDQFVTSASITNAAGNHSLKETAALLKNSLLVVSIDTGIMHLAAALGCPLIALHGPTSPKRWGAIGKQVIALTPPFPHTPCINLGFEKKCKTNKCMQSITLKQVQEAFSILQNQLSQSAALQK